MNDWIIVIISLIFSALFSGMEIAYITSNKLKIELEKRQGFFNAKILSGFLDNSSTFISTMIAGNSIAIIIYSIAMSKILGQYFLTIIPTHFYSNYVLLLIQTVISTMIILIVAEFLPKALFRINSNYILNLFAIPILIIYYMLYPIVYIIQTISKFVLSDIFRVKINTNRLAFNLGDIDKLIDESSYEENKNDETSHDIQMFHNAINFHNLKIRECMIPRTEISAIDENKTIDELRKLFIDTKFSKILIFKDSIDNITGYAHSSDLFHNPHNIKDIKRQIIFLPETMTANKLLTMFIQQRKSIAVVVDEFGGTAGMLTMEDLIEEIFGDIRDEYDTEDLTERKISENEYLFSGRLEIDYLNEKYNFNIPESNEYETLAGFVIFHHQSIPAFNTGIEIPPFHITILQASENRIVQLKFEVKNQMTAE